MVHIKQIAKRITPTEKGWVAENIKCLKNGYILVAQSTEMDFNMDKNLTLCVVTKKYLSKTTDPFIRLDKNSLLKLLKDGKLLKNSKFSRHVNIEWRAKKYLKFL